MAGTLPVTRASAGNNLAIGVAKISNTASSVSPLGISNLTLPAPLAYGGAGKGSAQLTLSFTEPNSTINAKSARFTFSGSIVQPLVTAGVQTIYGDAKVSAAAQKVTAPGFNSAAMPCPLVRDKSAAMPELNLDSIASAKTSKNIPFHFGPIVISAVSLGESTDFSQPYLSTAFSIRPKGIARSAVGLGFLYEDTPSSRPIHINLSGNRPPYDGRFNFGGADVIARAGGIKHGDVGAVSLSHAEVIPTVVPVSFASATYGSAILYGKDPRELQKKYGLLDIHFDKERRPTNSLNIGFYFWQSGQLSTYGFLSGLFGTSLVENSTPGIQPAGQVFSLYGNASIAVVPRIAVNGIDASGFSEPAVENKTKYVLVDGKTHSVIGSGSKVVLRTRWVIAKGHVSLSFGETMTSHGLRWLEPQGVDVNTYGTPWVSRSPRSLLPEPIFTDNPSNHSVSRKITIEPQGYEATLWGTRIIPESMTIYPQGFSESFGTAFAQLYTRYIKPRSFLSVGVQPADRWGWHLAYNLTQYISQYLIPDGGLVPPRWSEWQSIENRNKIVGVIGFNSMRHGYTNIENNARLLEAKGSDFNQYGSSMTAYRIRTVSPEPIEHPAMTSWSVVYNAARLIAVDGLQTGAYGEHKAINTRRYYERVGNFESLAMGLPMVSDRIRTVSIEPRYSIAPPIIRLPTIDWLTKYVSFNGYETAGYGVPSLSIRFNIIAPKWIHREKPGSPALKNLTPEIYIRGHDSSDFGASSIRTQWRTVEAQGDRATLFGLNRVSDTKQSISVRGTQSIGVSQNHKLTKLGTNAYALQYIWLDNESGYGRNYGIAPPDNQVSRPGLNQNMLYHQGKSLLAFGTAFVRTNNLVIESGIAIQNMSNGNTVYNKKRFVDVGGIKNEILLGKPRLSPHTIWAVKEAPAQAITNHYQGYLHYVGGYSGSPTSSVFGHAHIESTIRSLRAYGFYGDSGYARIGMPRLTNKKSFITPDSFRLSRFGIPSIPFTPQDIKVREGIGHLSFGSISVTRPPYVGPLYINMSGLGSNVFGRITADNFIRYVKAGGHNSLLMGTKKSNDSPYMWQGLRVGEIVPVVAGGYESLRMGSTTVWHRVRELQAAGFNTFSSGYELSQFRGRMTVSNATPPEDVVFEIIVPGREDSVIGQHGVKLGQHFIRPDGNSEQFRKGAW